MRRDPSHSSGMVQESSAACRASMGLAFKASSDPKHAGGDPPRPPRRNKRRRSLHPPRSKFRLFQPKNAFSSSRAFRRICIVWVKGGAQKTSFFKSPRIWCFGVLIALMGAAKGPYKVTALKSTWKCSKYGAIRPIFLFVLELVPKIRVAVRDGI